MVFPIMTDLGDALLKLLEHHLEKRRRMAPRSARVPIKRKVALSVALVVTPLLTNVCFFALVEHRRHSKGEWL